MNPVELVKWTPPRAQDVSRGTAEEKLDDVSAETNKEESDDEEEKGEILERSRTGEI